MPSATRVRRHTVQRDAVSAALRDADGFISAQELHRQLVDRGSGVGLATVYRQLNSLAEDGEADTIAVASGQMFRACSHQAHHHHLVCERCGAAIEIAAPDEEWFQRVASEHGFRVSHHTVEIFGLCSDCQQA